MALYNDQQRQKVISIACAAVASRASGKSKIASSNGKSRQEFDLDTGGYCNRFVRQCFETALGIAPFKWRFGAARACLTLEKLRPYKIHLKDRQPGDILGFAGDPGHIAIYLGREFDQAKELVAENTSATRGWPRKPGTKVTSYDSLRKRVTGCYRLFTD